MNFMKISRITLLLACCYSAIAATTTVAQTIINPDGTLASGTVLIRISSPCRSGTSYTGDKTISVRFTAGAFSVPLIANDTCVPGGTSYGVRWLLAGGNTRSETWVVPTSATPVTVDSVVVSIVPTSSLLLALNQISTAGASEGYVITFTGGAWHAAPGGGGGGALHWSAITLSQLSAITASTWSTIRL